MVRLRLQFRVQALSAILLLNVMIGCSWTPRVETSIYEGQQGRIYLTTVTKEPFEANHPVTIQTETLAKVLRGLQIRESKRLLQQVLSGEAKPQQVFTEEQIEMLTPELKKAFSQVTPEEQVVIESPGNIEKDIRAIKSAMFVQGDDLHITMDFHNYSPPISTKSLFKSVRPDQTGRNTPIVVFTPKEAVRGEPESHWLLRNDEKNDLIINIPLLASLHQDNLTDTMQSKQEAPLSLPASAPQVSQPISPGADTPPPASTAQTPENQNTELLMEEIRTLRKELDEQKEAIEKLKQKKE